MLLTSSNESQAVLGRLFFSHSAATLCRGTPDPTLRLSGSARRPALTPAGPSTGPGPAGGRAGLLPILRHWEVRAGSGQALAQAGPGARSLLALRGFRRLVGGAAAGLPEFGTQGSARTVLTRSGHSVAVSAKCWCVCCLDDLGPLGAYRGGECAASTPSRGSLGALWCRMASAAPGSCPFLCSEQCAGLAGAQAVGFTAGRSPWA
jgi:hypothetical protein